MCGQVCGDKVWRRAEEEKAEEEPGIQNQKQEPHTKMWGNTLMNLFEVGVERLVAQGSVPNVYVCTSFPAASVLQHRRKVISNDQLAHMCLRADAAAQGQHPHVGRLGNLIAGSLIKLD